MREHAPRTASMRPLAGEQRVTNVELFFDLVYVFAVTQLSHRLLAQLTWVGAGETALLLAMVWLQWVYTTWLTNWLDPRRLGVRALLLALMLASLAMSTSLPSAFGPRGLVIGLAYAGMAIVRSAVGAVAMRGHPLGTNFARITVWCCVSGALAIAGGVVRGDARPALWLAAVAVDLAGGLLGFVTPGLGRSSTLDWEVSGRHFAERCQAFVLIALGESVVTIGATASDLEHIGPGRVLAFVLAFLGAAALWWLYFDRSAEDAADVVEASADPGALARSAYHFVHPVMVAGIIVTAAADERVLAAPTTLTPAVTAWFLLGGTALFVAGHGAFEAVVWRVVPRVRIAAVVVLGLLGLVAHRLPVVALGACVAVVVVAVAVADRLRLPASEQLRG